MRIFSLFAVLCCFFLAACTGSSDSGSLDVEKADSKQIASAPDKIEIPVGAPASRVLQLLGQADSITAGANGREIWRYSGKRAGYVYSSNSNNVQMLIIGNYSRGGADGVPLLLTIVFDPAKKVVDFNFAQMAF
ncbi:hypothetical protein LJC26_03900 [Desulfovibrio sp. OttesenSCG-928-O18]|nr:hypothetical protein [Desulfovibrio sp. OttesenSCG-928-O18]